jgi:hypothetical protein
MVSPFLPPALERTSTPLTNADPPPFGRWWLRARWLTFRRIYSSWSHDKGVPGKVVAQLMGHANVDTTLNVYTQMLDGSLREAVDKVGGELFTNARRRKRERPLTGRDGVPSRSSGRAVKSAFARSYDPKPRFRRLQPRRSREAGRCGHSSRHRADVDEFVRGYAMTG